jgi:hypothetical protein
MFWPLQQRMLDADDQDVPMVYSLTWDGLNLSFIFTVAAGAFDFLCDKLADGREVGRLRDTSEWPEGAFIEHGFTPPCGPDQPWGYLDLGYPGTSQHIALADPELQSENPSWRIPLPDISTTNRDLRWSRMAAVAATIKHAIDILSCFDDEGQPTDQSQGMALNLAVRPNGESGGGNIKVVLGYRTTQLLKAPDPDLRDRIATAVNDVCRILTPPEFFTELRVALGDDMMRIESQSDNGASISRDSREKRVLVTHNCDGPGKQLPFLAGFAALVTACQSASTANASTP